MNNQKICFIMCVNNDLYAQESIHYLEHLRVPEGVSREILTVKGAESMTSGYNQAMSQSDAKYKVYIHQDVFIIYQDFISRIMKIFENPKIGMMGVVGSRKLDDTAVMWYGERVGMLHGNSIYQATSSIFGKVEGEYQEVEAVDGLLLATQYDIPWREDIFKKWDFYDLSQSMEFRKRGYQVVVPHTEKPWCIHDDGILDFSNYYTEREVFLKEYR